MVLGFEGRGATSHTEAGARVVSSPPPRFTAEVVGAKPDSGQCADGGYGDGLENVWLGAVVAFREEELFVVRRDVGGVVYPPGPSFSFPFGEALALEEGLIDHGILGGIVEEVVYIPFREPFGDV